jgi:hypothetical protein
MTAKRYHRPSVNYGVRGAGMRWIRTFKGDLAHHDLPGNGSVAVDCVDDTNANRCTTAKGNYKSFFVSMSDRVGLLSLS